MARRRTPMETFSFRAPRDVIEAGKRTAEKRDEYLGDALRDFVTRYAREELRAARTAPVTYLAPPLVDLPEDFLDHGPRPKGQVGWRCRYCGKGRMFLGTVREEAAEARAHEAQCHLSPDARPAKPDTEETQS